MNLPDFQSAVVDALKSVSWLSSQGISILTDDGYQNDEAQTALETSGCCVVVGMPSSGTLEAPVGKSASGTAILIVDMIFNQKVNRSLAVPRDPVYVLVVIGTAINSATTLPRVRNVQAGDFDLATFDEGLLAYTITVQAKVEFIP